MKPRLISTARLSFALASALAVLLAAPAAHAATWNAGAADSTDGLWSTATNWTSDTAPINGDALVFDELTNQTNTNDIPLTSIGALTLNNAGWDITLGTLTLNGGIAANGNATLDGALTLGGSQSWTNSAGLLNVTGTLAGGAYNLQINGAGDTTISSTITGLDGGLTKAGGGTLTLSDANINIPGRLIVGGGTLRLAGTTALTTTTGDWLRIGGGVLQMDGGELNHVGGGGLLFGEGAGSGGTLNQTGGTINFSGGVVYGGYSAASAANFSGGTFNAPITWNNGVNGTMATSISGTADVRLGTFNFGAGAASSTLSLTGGTLTLNNGLARANGTHTATFNGGVLRAGSTGTFAWAHNASVTATLTGSGMTFDSNGRTNPSIAQTLGGGGSLTKTGEGTLTLTGTKSYTGGTTVSAGRLVFQNNTAGAHNYAANALATLEFNVTTGTKQLSGGSLTGGGTLVKSGVGSLLLGANGAPQGVAMSSGGLIDVQGGVLRNEYGNSGWGSSNKADANVAAGAYLDLWDGDITVDALTGSGTVNAAWAGGRTLTVGVDNGSGTFSGKISNVANPGGGYSGAGAATISLVKAGSGTQTLSGANTYSGATHVNAGTLAVSATGSINSSSGVNINGGTLRYNASTNLSPTVTFTSGTIAGTNWNGALSGLTIGAGKTISPGNSPGTATTGSQTWAGSGSYLFEINNATGTAGADPGWDLLSGTGTLDITATGGTKFDIILTSLTLGNIAGDAANFNDATSYNWLFADFTNAITGYAADKFFVNTDAFDNALTGTFGVALGDTIGGGDNTQLYLTYAAIPEPRAALLGGLGMLALLRRRRS